jgi:Bacterial archaeo-eukaryotic release factor family 3
MHSVTQRDLTTLLNGQRPPCVSIYLPTHKGFPGDREDPVYFRNLVDQVEGALTRKYPKEPSAEIRRRLHDLAADNAFWEQRLDGLAILGSHDTFRVFHLERPVPERVIVGDSFHIKPLLRIVQSADRFHVLCLQREAVRLFDGNRDRLAPIEPPGVPLTITAALGNDVAVQRKAQGPFGTSPGETHPAPRPPTARPGHPRSGDDAKLDTQRFFRAVARAVWQHVCRPSGLPLVLVALPEHQALFRSICHIPQLLETGVESSPAGMGPPELLQKVWKCVEPTYLSRLGKMVDDFRVAHSRHMASDDLSKVARAAHDGRVGILLVEADRVIPGWIDAATGGVRRNGAHDPNASDLLDEVAELVLRTKGAVVVVPRDRMPSDTGLAAIYRFEVARKPALVTSHPGER